MRVLARGNGFTHWGAGAVDVLGRVGGEPVYQPLEAIDRLPEGHPYHLVGQAAVRDGLDWFSGFAAGAGLTHAGDLDRNRGQVTAFGTLRQTCLLPEPAAGPDRVGFLHGPGGGGELRRVPRLLGRPVRDPPAPDPGSTPPRRARPCPPGTTTATSPASSWPGRSTTPGSAAASPPAWPGRPPGPSVVVVPAVLGAEPGPRALGRPPVAGRGRRWSRRRPPRPRSPACACSPPTGPGWRPSACAGSSASRRSGWSATATG